MMPREARQGRTTEGTSPQGQQVALHLTSERGPEPAAPRPPVIAIDGPAAAGKGTLARRLAEVLGLPYLDTGLLYRAVGRRVLDAGADPADPAAAAAAAAALQPDDVRRGDLRGPAADAAAAAVASLPAVRAALLDFQRGFAVARGAVLDGRDIGTVIFPDAPVKLFVTASLAARARRRWAELEAKGVRTFPRPGGGGDAGPRRDGRRPDRRAASPGGGRGAAGYHRTRSRRGVRRGAAGSAGTARQKLTRPSGLI